MKINQDDLLTKLSRHIPGMVYQYRLFPDGRSCMPYCSEGIQDLFGFSPQEVAQEASLIFARVEPEDLEGVLRSIRDSARTLQDWKFEARVNHPTKGIRWMHGASRPEHLEDGSIIWHGSIHDITERKRTEA